MNNCVSIFLTARYVTCLQNHVINKHPEGGCTSACFEFSVRQLETPVDEIEKMSTISEACLYDWDVERMLEWLREVSLNLAGG